MRWRASSRPAFRGEDVQRAHFPEQAFGSFKSLSLLPGRPRKGFVQMEVCPGYFVIPFRPKDGLTLHRTSKFW
jgi:hypothetical protein